MVEWADWFQLIIIVIAHMVYVCVAIFFFKVKETDLSLLVI